MRMYQYDKHLDFHALGREIKRKREEKGWTQEYLAQLVNRTPRSIMYIENRGQYPSFDTFYQLVTLLEISVDQFFFPDKLNGESTCRKHDAHSREGEICRRRPRSARECAIAHSFIIQMQLKNNTRF